jgi:hypothetical protein
MASVCGHNTHSITSRYMYSADVVLLAAADAVANAAMKLMGATTVAGSAARWISRVGRIHFFIGVFVTHGFGRYPTSATASAISRVGRIHHTIGVFVPRGEWRTSACWRRPSPRHGCVDSLAVSLHTLPSCLVRVVSPMIGYSLRSANRSATDASMTSTAVRSISAQSA